MCTSLKLDTRNSKFYSLIYVYQGGSISRTRILEMMHFRVVTNNYSDKYVRKFLSIEHASRH